MPKVPRATALHTMSAAAQAAYELGPVGPAGQPLNWLARIHAGLTTALRHRAMTSMLVK